MMKKFTVIGNLLIVHVAFDGNLDTNDIICEVPPGIGKRLKYLGFTGCYNRSPYSPIFNVQFYVQGIYLAISTPGKYTNGEFFAIADLKDI